MKFILRMNAKEMHSPEARFWRNEVRPYFASIGAPKKKVTDQTLFTLWFLFLNWALFVNSSSIVYNTIFKIGLIPDATVEFLLGVSFWPAFFVVTIFLIVKYALVGMTVSRFSAKWMMKYQGVLLIALVFTTGSLISPSVGFHYKLKSGLESGIAKGMSGFDKNNSNAYNAYALQVAQVKFNCCGWEGPEDYLTMDKAQVPVSCCKNDGFTETRPFATCLLASATREGCRFSDAYLYTNFLKVAFIIELVLLALLFFHVLPGLTAEKK